MFFVLNAPNYTANFISDAEKDITAKWKENSERWAQESCLQGKRAKISGAGKLKVKRYICNDRNRFLEKNISKQDD